MTLRTTRINKKITLSAKFIRFMDQTTTHINIDEIEAKITLKDTGKTKATITVNFSDIFVVKGFRIIESEYDEDGLWLAPPAYRTNKGYGKLFFINDEVLWKELNDKLIKLYKEQANS